MNAVVLSFVMSSVIKFNNNVSKEKMDIIKGTYIEHMTNIVNEGNSHYNNVMSDNQFLTKFYLDTENHYTVDISEENVIYEQFITDYDNINIIPEEIVVTVHTGEEEEEEEENGEVEENGEEEEEGDEEEEEIEVEVEVEVEVEETLNEHKEL